MINQAHYCLENETASSGLAIQKSALHAGRSMTKYAISVCYMASIATVYAAITERDALEWTGVAIAAGASVFAWGLGRYHEFRKQRREEDHQDRLNMLEDIRAHTRVLCEMESRQEVLKRNMDSLLADMKRIRCAFPSAERSTEKINDASA